MSSESARPRRAPGRQAEAAANDRVIMAAAFETLTADPGASMAEVAARAGVGVASLYRRHPTRQDLVHHLCLHAMAAITETAAECRRQLAAPGADPWARFVDFAGAALDAGAGAMRVLVGTFAAGPALAEAAVRMNATIGEVVTTLQADGVLRADVTAADLTLFFEMLRGVGIGDPVRDAGLRRRYLRLFVGSLRATAATEPLPASAPDWQEISSRWSEPRTHDTRTNLSRSRRAL